MFGPGFLFPVGSWASTSSGSCRLVAHRGLADRGRFIFVFAAVATPTADPFTMFVFAAPLTVLYFAAYVVCRVLDKRKAKARPDWLDVDDTEASPALTGPGGRDRRAVVSRRAPGR